MVYASDCTTNNSPTSLASHEVTTNRRVCSMRSRDTQSPSHGAPQLNARKRISCGNSSSAR